MVCFSKYLQLFNNEELSALTDMPIIEVFDEGETSFFVSETYFASLSDITRDPYSPWTGSFYNDDGFLISTKTHCYNTFVSKHGETWIEDPEAVADLDFENQFVLKVFMNQHPKTPALKREVAYVYDVNKNLATPVLYIYICNEKLSPIHSTKKRKLPSEIEVIKEAMKHRNTTEAKRALLHNGIRVTTSQICSLSRTVESHKKTKAGRKAATDVSKLFDRYASKNNYLERLMPVIVENNEDKVSITQIFGYPLAFKCFSRSLPTLEELDEHCSTVERMKDMTRDEADNEFESFLKFCNPSGSLPLIGATILIDTTFSICIGEYLTLAVAVTEEFRNRSSGKNASMLLGGMIHSRKNLEAHEHFSNFLNKMLSEADITKRVPSTITDGENAFSVYNTGTILKDSVSLRCDFHRCNNLKEVCSNNEEYEILKRKLFGYKKNTTQGIVLRKGILSALRKQDFERDMNELILEEENEKVVNWLKTNWDSLFNQSSLCKKIRGGWTLQFLSTNIIEGRNAHLKNLIPTPILAHHALEILLKLHEDEMTSRLNAIAGKDSFLMTPQARLDWQSLTREQRRRVLVDFGLESFFFESEFSKYPSWFYSGDGKVPQDAFLEFVEGFEVHQSMQEKSNFFIKVENFQKISVVVFDDLKLVCHHPSCMKHRDYAFYMCSHMLAAFRKLSEEEQRVAFQNLEEKRKSRTVRQIRFRTQQVLDGTKYSRRRGKQFSRTNHSRAYHAITNESLNSSHGNASESEDERQGYFPDLSNGTLEDEILPIED